ncbi:MAG: hypothetical protein O7E54_07900 [Planctomycetota bacterium]|nr:hypothetical protein [Planctomycetota bacterium]
MRKWWLGAGIVLAAAVALANEREEKVRKDKSDFRGRKGWIYNDLPNARAAAKKSGKPLFVVIRCIP